MEANTISRRPDPVPMPAGLGRFVLARVGQDKGWKRVLGLQNGGRESMDREGGGTACGSLLQILNPCFAITGTDPSSPVGQAGVHHRGKYPTPNLCCDLPVLVQVRIGLSFSKKEGILGGLISNTFRQFQRCQATRDNGTHKGALLCLTRKPCQLLLMRT